jgi:phosphoribosylpyrophosphate synthetase
LQVIVSNSLPIPTGSPRSDKVVQLSVAPLVAHVILTEHLRSKTTEIEEFQLEE